MRLEEVQLNGLGRFTDKKCGFRVEKYHLDEPWPYIYTTRSLLLRVDQRGPDYVQFSPPAGTVFFRRERYQSVPSCLMWIKTAEGRAFSSFYRPAIPPTQEPEEFFCEYTPEKAHYHVRQDSILCETAIFVPEDEAVVVVTYAVTNSDCRMREIELLPALRPHLAAAGLAPWDVPALYQMVEYSNDLHHLFYMELRSPAGIPEFREYAFVLSDIRAPDGIEVDYDSFIGRGTFENPEALHGKPLTIEADKRHRYGDYSPANSVNGKQGVVALHKRLRLEPGESFSFTLVMGSPNLDARGVKPTLVELTRFEKYLDASTREKAMRTSLKGAEESTGRREISTPDKAFNRYVNEYLPLQLKWVRILDRGWPTGLRGVRDNAQDTTALIPLDRDGCRRTLLDLFGIQRTDGWFPRQYAIKGRHGKHDLRSHVDGGVWVWELLYDYLCFTKDFALLQERTAYLDSERESPLLLHAIELIGYYLDDDNVGEHGLCLIREGDWNDSINRAGREGRGESVMVSCQAVLALKQAAHLLDFLSNLGELEPAIGPSDLRSHSRVFLERAERLKSDLLAHALNEDGYLNGVFTDNGEWVFSAHDPDGKKRISVPVNSFGIISGVLRDDNLRRALDVLVGMKRRDGWPLFHPPIGKPPIPKLGRIGQGDLSPGLGENGAIYNHGCHGFLGRAAAAAGEGDLLVEILSYMLPYDQERHPVQRSKTAPYGMVNHWKTAPGVEGRGGDCFLTGSISGALRSVYNGVFGIEPLLDGLALDPVMPKRWGTVSVRFSYLGANVAITYTGERADGEDAIVIVNGDEITSKRNDIVLDREYVVIPDGVFKAGRRYDVRYIRSTGAG